MSDPTHPPVRDGWHFRREIQLGHIITTVTIALSAALYVTALDKRITVLETAIQHQRERDNRQDEATAEKLGVLRQQLDRVEAKLDRLIERGERRPTP